MKQGKVFEKLAARKNVQGITFQDKTCTVTLTTGLTQVCHTAHQARLFIEDKAPSVGHGLTPREATIRGLAEELFAKQVGAEAAERVRAFESAFDKCGTEAPATITLDADFVRLCCPDAVIPAGAMRVRVRTEQAAIMIAAGPVL